jgi:hypothetical protein
MFDDASNHDLTALYKAVRQPDKEVTIRCDIPLVAYDPRPDVAEGAVRRICDEMFPDLIIVGHNRPGVEFKMFEGMISGLQKASVIQPGLRCRVIIVWESHPGQEIEERYRDMGYTKFCSRGNLPQCLVDNKVLERIPAEEAALRKRLEEVRLKNKQELAAEQNAA